MHRHVHVVRHHHLQGTMVDEHRHGVSCRNTIHSCDVIRVRHTDAQSFHSRLRAGSRVLDVGTEWVVGELACGMPELIVGDVIDVFPSKSLVRHVEHRLLHHAHESPSLSGGFGVRT